VAEVARAAVPQGAHRLGGGGGEGSWRGVARRGALGQGRDPGPGAGVERGAGGLLVAAAATGEPGDVVAARTGGDHLPAAECVGIRGAPAQPHRVALGVRQRTYQ
jgi:hypothetical protein